MTVSYAGYGGNFGKLLLRWRGSIWKSLCKDLLVYLALYYAISLIYRLALNPSGRLIFEKIAGVCHDYTKQVPLTFLLGFYVGIVVKRWWEQFQYLPWPDNVMFWVSAYFRGKDEKSQRIRRQIARYLILTAALALRGLSVRVYKRFPTLEHVEAAGLMTKSERKFYDSIHLRFQPHHHWFLPLNWCLTIFMKHIDIAENGTSVELKQLIKAIEYYRKSYEQIFIYDWITVPLVYTQVATIATYGYFGLCLVGSQYLTPEKPHKGYEIDLYVPFFTILQFLFYVGWLKVGEDLMNPFGEDDEDFELNYLLDRHTEMAYLIADIHGQLPPWEPSKLDGPFMSFRGFPDTKASAACADTPPRFHLKSIKLSSDDQLYAERKEPSECPPGDELNLENGLQPRPLEFAPHLGRSADHNEIFTVDSYMMNAKQTKFQRNGSIGIV